jgi:hypothetical protein
MKEPSMRAKRMASDSGNGWLLPDSMIAPFFEVNIPNALKSGDPDLCRLVYEEVWRLVKDGGMGIIYTDKWYALKKLRKKARIGIAK